MNKPIKRLAYIDVLNVASAFGVVALHVNGCFWEGPAQGWSWPSANFIETFFFWPVPVFFMISGATLMGYRDRMGTRKYLQRRFAKTVVPFLLWSLVAVIYCWLRARAMGWDFDASPRSVISNVINAKYNSTYWFFPPLFALYLSIPVISFARYDEHTLWFTAAVGLLTVSVLPLACPLAGLTWNGAVTPPPVTGYMLYVLLGWLLSRRELPKKVRLALYVLGVAGWLIHMLGTLALSSPEAGVVKTFKGYTNIPNVLQAVAVFVLVRHADFGHGVARRVAQACAKLSGLTFGVYLTHWYLVNALATFGPFDVHSLRYRVAATFAVFGVCLAATWLIKKVPGLRRMVP